MATRRKAKPTADAPRGREPAPSQAAPAPSLARPLAIGGGSLLALGIAIVGCDVFTGIEHPVVWAPIVLGALALLVAAGASALAEPRSDLAVVDLGERDARRTTTITIAAACVLALQALVPLRYYLGDDAYDERFSWRMFSAVRMHRCELAAFESRGDEPEARARLTSTIHVGWITTMERNRRAVIDRYLRWRCEEGAHRARVVDTCVSPAGVRIPPIEHAIDCGTGSSTESGGLPP